MNITIEAPQDCGRSLVTATINWASGTSTAEKQQRIDYLLFAINDRVDPRDVRVSFPTNLGPIQGSEPWSAPYHERARFYRETAQIVLARLPHRATEVQLRMTANVARPAGHLACYVSTPQLQDYASNTQALEAAQYVADGWLGKQGRGSKLPGVGCCVANDSIVDARVREMIPDRGALDAGGIVIGRSVRVACGVQHIEPDPSQKNDPWYYAATLAMTSNCGAVQTFRAINAATDLNIRLFAAGVLVSAAAAILIEALMASHLGSQSPLRRGSAS
jgi:hypothetical protein